MPSIKNALLFFLFAFTFQNIFAQSKDYKPNLRWYLDEGKTSYAGFLMVNQIWTRYIENNPDKNGVEQYPDFDLGIRRSRLIFYTSLFDKAFIYTQAGFDGLTYRSGKNPGISLINAETEYHVIKDKLSIGFGLNTWNGVSRYNNCKLLEFLVVDNPGFVYPVGGIHDIAGRQLGIYAKGSLKKLHYRISIAKPLEAGTDSLAPKRTQERINENFAVKGYFTWQFFDKDNLLFPYLTMNNLGKGKLINVGAGFYYHPEAIGGSLNGVSQISDIFLSAVDLFVDLPFKSKAALTSYLGYYYYFFGKDYLRSMSKMNVSRMASTITLPQGAGNSEWEVGTGHIIRGEVGYLLPKTIIKSKLQPFGAFTFKSFEALDQPSVQFDAGANLLQYGHNLKWTLQYSTRPVYTLQNGLNKISQYKGQVILQTQIYF